MAIASINLSSKFIFSLWCFSLIFSRSSKRSFNHSSVGERTQSLRFLSVFFAGGVFVSSSESPVFVSLAVEQNYKYFVKQKSICCTKKINAHTKSFWGTGDCAYWTCATFATIEIVKFFKEFAASWVNPRLMIMIYYISPCPF